MRAAVPAAAPGDRAAARSIPQLTPTEAVSITTELSQSEWDDYVERHPDSTAEHLWHWRVVFESVFGQRCVYLAARRGGAVVGVLPLVLFRSMLFGRFAVSVPYLNYGGMLVSDAQAAAALLERATAVSVNFGASHVELRHQSRQLKGAPSRGHKVRMVLALPSSSEHLWSNIDRKVRNQVRKAQKERLTSEVGGPDHLDEFYRVFAVNMRDLGTPVYSARLFAEILRVFPDRARVHIVRHQGRAVAGSVTIQFRDTVVVPWAASLRAARHLCPNMLLYWSMLEYSIAQGARAFDFGRSSRGAGTHHFKQQWGATEIGQHWEYVLLSRSEPPDQGTGNAKFEAAIAAWRRLPIWLTKLVGPRLVANIP